MGRCQADRDARPLRYRGWCVVLQEPSSRFMSGPAHTADTGIMCARFNVCTIDAALAAPEEGPGNVAPPRESL
jgi:hypothetical protein